MGHFGLLVGDLRNCFLFLKMDEDLNRESNNYFDPFFKTDSLFLTFY